MEMYTGKSIFKGIAIGKILFYQKGEQPVKRVKIEDTAEQIKRYEDARAKAAEQLQGLYEKALKEVGEANAAVFEAVSYTHLDVYKRQTSFKVPSPPSTTIVWDALQEVRLSLIHIQMCIRDSMNAVSDSMSEIEKKNVDFLNSYR